MMLNLYERSLSINSLISCFLLATFIIPQLLQAQTYSRSFNYSYTPNQCSTYRSAAPQESSSCLEEGIRTSKLELSKNGTFLVKLTDRSTREVHIINSEGVYEKREGQLVFTLQKEHDNAGNIRFLTRQEVVQYELVEEGIYLKGGDALLWGRGASEREGLFR